jgi:hypothetical protein
MNDRQDDKLMQEARRLATEVSPGRDLWPGIAEAIAKPATRYSRWTPMLAQAAAVLALVGGSSMVTWYLVSEEPQVIEVYRPALHAELAAYGDRESLGQDYDRVHGEVASQLKAELEKLSPEARADVERNMAVINQAIADIGEALNREPDNELLRDLLADAYREELVIMQRVGTLTRQVMARQDI